MLLNGATDLRRQPRHFVLNLFGCYSLVTLDGGRKLESGLIAVVDFFIFDSDADPFNASGSKNIYFSPLIEARQIC